MGEIVPGRHVFSPFVGAKSMVADDAVLFLWATSPILEDSFRLINVSGVRAWAHRLSCRA